MRRALLASQKSCGSRSQIASLLRSLHTTSVRQSSTQQTQLTESRPTALNVSNLYRPEGSQSNGIVATVFGCTGFLGRYIVNELANIGAQVIVPYRGDGMNVRHLKVLGDLGQIVPIPFDMRDEESIKRTMTKSNVVINLVGCLYQTPAYNYDDVHVKTTHRLAKIARSMSASASASGAYGVERFIQMSTVGAHPESRSKWIQSKYASEQVARDFFPDATIIRSAPIFGPEDNLTNTTAYCFNFPHRVCIPLFNEGKGLIQPVSAVDVGRGVVSTLGRDEAKSSVYEFGGDELYTQREMYHALADAMLVPKEYLDNFTNVPYPLAKAWAQMREKIPYMLALGRYWSPDHIEQWYTDRVVNPHQSTKTLRDLGVQPISFKHELYSLMLAHRHGRLAREDLDTNMN